MRSSEYQIPGNSSAFICYTMVSTNHLQRSIAQRLYIHACCVCRCSRKRVQLSATFSCLPAVMRCSQSQIFTVRPTSISSPVTSRQTGKQSHIAPLTPSVLPPPATLPCPDRPLPAPRQLRINFNITMLALPCDYASVDVLDLLGTNKVNMTKNIVKVRS